jgi:probable HAF family extracellular repeat protein
MGKWTWVFLIVGLSLSSVLQAQYQATDLGVLPGTRVTYATCINNSGDIAGNTIGDTGVGSFVWHNGVMTPIPVTPTYGINSAGQTVGGSQLYSNGQITDLGFTAYAINNSGWIVGDSGQQRAMLWRNSSAEDISNGGRYTLAFDVNNVGQVVLYSYLRAAIWTENTNSFMDLQNPVDAIGSFGQTINDFGTVGGIATFSRQQGVNVQLYDMPAIWRGGQISILPLLPNAIGGHITDINNKGQAVGYCDLNGQLRACTWIDDIPYDISQNYGSDAWAINDAGQIVGESAFDTGVNHAVVWNPVPEPSSILTLLCGLGCGVGILRRKLGHN